MKLSMVFRGIAPALALVAAMTGAAADTAAERGRAVYEQYKDTVVTVHMVLATTFNGEEDESDTWTNGTVIAADGLTAIPLTSADPYAAMLRALPPDQRSQVETKVTQMEIVANGVHVPAEAVIRDPDLDLMLVRPVDKPETPWVCTGTDNLGEPGLLEETVVIMQLGEIARRAHTAMIARVEAVVTEPRRYYHLGDDRSDGLIAAPAFTLDGKFIGIGVYRTVRSAEGGADTSVVVLPASEIAKAVAQAPPRQAVA